MNNARAAKRAKEKADALLIGKIAQRYLDWQIENKCLLEKFSLTGTIVLLIQVRSANPELQFDFQKFLDFEEFDFLHDIMGIILNARFPTGKLGNHFVPRCAE